MDLNPSCVDYSVGSLSNLSSSRSQDFILEESSQEILYKSTPLKSVQNTKNLSDRDKMSSMASSRSSLSTNAAKYVFKLKNFTLSFCFFYNI